MNDPSIGKVTLIQKTDFIIIIIIFKRKIILASTQRKQLSMRKNLKTIKLTKHVLITESFGVPSFAFL